MMFKAPASSSLHPFSLVDESLHSRALLQFIDSRPSKKMFDYIAHRVSNTVNYALGRVKIGASKSSPEMDEFAVFVASVLTRAQVSTAIILAALVYVDRSKPYLQIVIDEWALERVFLGAVIVASKYLDEPALRNYDWAICTDIFGLKDIGRIEQEFLNLLDWQLRLSEDDILFHHRALSSPIPLSPRPFSPHRIFSHLLDVSHSQNPKLEA